MIVMKTSDMLIMRWQWKSPDNDNPDNDDNDDKNGFDDADHHDDCDKR